MASSRINDNIAVLCLEMSNKKFRSFISQNNILIDRGMDVAFYVFVSFATIIVFLIILGLLVMYLLIGQTIYKQIQAKLSVVISIDKSIHNMINYGKFTY
jgi:hypothetical protein